MILFDNNCVKYSESSAVSQTGINYIPPTRVEFSDAENESGKPALEYKLKVDREALSSLGLNIKLVAQTLQAAIKGKRATYFRVNDDEFDVNVVKHAARVGAELGADIVKVNYTGSAESFKEVVDGCPVPVVIAGGEKTETDEQILQMVRGAMDAGAGGVSIGRNAFQHINPEKITRAIYNIVHHDYTVEKAVKILK